MFQNYKSRLWLEYSFPVKWSASTTKHCRKIPCNLLRLICALLNRQTSSYSEYASIYSQRCTQHKPLQTKQIRFSVECSAGLRCWLETPGAKDGATWSHLKSDWIKVFSDGLEWLILKYLAGQISESLLCQFRCISVTILPNLNGQWCL